MAGGHGTIGIHFIPSDGYHWAEFLQQKLNEDGYNIKSMLLDLTTTSHSHFFETNVLLVSPDFFNLSNIGALLSIDPHRALMVLLGTEASDIRNFLMTHKCTEMLKYITFFETVATEQCVRELLIGIIKLYEHVHETSDEEAEQYDTLPPPRRSTSSNQTDTPTNFIHSVAVSCNEDREIFILCDRKGSEEIQIQLSDDRSPVKAVHENKAIYRFTIDRNLTQRNLQFTAKDGQLIMGTGKVIIPRRDDKDIDVQGHKSKLEILQDILGKENDPICLMCKALNLTDTSKESLDRNLANKCKNLDALRRFDGTFFDVDRKSKVGHSNEAWPTLLHFAAEFNLPRFCEELLKLPYSMDETLKMNRDNETPLDIAKRKGHRDVANKLSCFVDTQTKNGNVPGNKDSGVVEDDIQPPPETTLKSSDTYADMSQIDTQRDSSLDVGGETYDYPPPNPHSSKTYVNLEDPPPPVAHIPSRPKFRSGDSESDTGSVYMDMAGKSAPNITQLPHDHYSYDPMHRTKSESQAHADEEDEDYEVPDDFDENVKFDIQSIHSSSSYQDNISIRVQEEGDNEIQLPTQAHHGHRHSGFFKKFKLFGKHNKKEKKPQRGRKMSLPTEVDLQAFQVYRAERRGSVAHIHNRHSSSSNSSEESGHHNREDKAKSMDPFAEDTKRKKKKHFLNKDARKSIRITKAMADQAINPLPLPSKSQKHLFPPEL